MLPQKRRLPLSPAVRRWLIPRAGVARQLSSSSIHPTAVLESGVRLGRGVKIGPYCVVCNGSVIGDGVRLDAHVRVAERTRIGANSTISSFATLGALPQDLKYTGEPSHVIIGVRCRIAEYVLLSGGTTAGGGVTELGNGCFIMSHCHVAHDCVLGDGVVLASSVALAGHVHIGEGARISGFSCVQQKVHARSRKQEHVFWPITSDQFAVTNHNFPFPGQRWTRRIPRGWICA